MEISNKYITVAYELFADFDGKHEMVEKATEAHPFQFISGMGLTLDDFEAHIVPLQKGEKFDFTLVPELAYGPRFEEAVQALPRNVFEIDGKLNTDYIYEGAVVPLNNAEGERFNGTIVEITDTTITVDLNHPLAGHTLQFVGVVTENREATNAEIEQMAKMLAGECGCGGGCGDCGGDCGGGCSGGCGGCK
ncbi:MAG: FKBP-type peptidyl-prolyl cis-trans isomerase [Bacteroidaceae bacterium]|nr:FKBP-type peptidyl-prolyl cis-trans isomerase [Bacteroidaceae bacterium]